MIRRCVGRVSACSYSDGYSHGPIYIYIYAGIEVHGYFTMMLLLTPNSFFVSVFGGTLPTPAQSSLLLSSGVKSLQQLVTPPQPQKLTDESLGRFPSVYTVGSGEAGTTSSSSTLLYFHRDHKDCYGRGDQNGHLDFHTAPELCGCSNSVLLYVYIDHKDC